MRLAMVTGFRDYLEPTQIDPTVLAEGLRAIDPAPIVPRVRWHLDADLAAPVPTTCYATFLDEPGPGDAELRTQLLIEYVQDTTPSEATAYIVLPTELHDVRLRRLIDHAQATFGDAAVRCRRLYLSERTQAVLDRLRAAAGEATISGAGAAPGGTAIASTALDQLDPTSPGLAGLRAAMQRNYTHAVLALGARIVARASVFTSDDRTDALARLLDHNRMTIRADLDPDRVLVELAPGGELFGLLTRPLPPDPAPATLIELELATAKVVARS